MPAPSDVQPRLPLLKPDCAITTVIASFELSKDTVKVHFPEKRDDFREVIKGLGYRWSDRCWMRRIDFTTGAPSDRAAEAARVLVGSGFIVDIRDSDAHSKAISGDYEPEKTRWVTHVVSGDFFGWCRIAWSRRDDLYAAARTLPGSRYREGAVYVPASAIEAVADFADRYAFSMSAGIKRLLHTHLDSLANGVVLNLQKRAKPTNDLKPQSETGRPSRIDVPMDTSVDSDLMDDI